MAGILLPCNTLGGLGIIMENTSTSWFELFDFFAFFEVFDFFEDFVIFDFFALFAYFVFFALLTRKLFV